MTTDKQDENQDKILKAAEQLLRGTGRDNITIRAVAEAACVQLPTIYRLFGDKQGLLDAIAEQGFVRYMKDELSYDKSLGLIEELRVGWNFHVQFGIENPELYALMYGKQYAGQLTSAAQIAHKGFMGLIARLAEAGYLRVNQQQALFTIFASASGAVLTTLALPKTDQAAKYCDEIRESMIASITNQSSHEGGRTVAKAAIVLSANLESLEAFSKNEKSLLSEWLSRIS